MESYIDKYDSFDKKMIYIFKLGDGGIGDCIKFFMFVLESCMKNNIRLYYNKNNLEIEKYIKLKYDKMYILLSRKVRKNILISIFRTDYSTINFS